ncbi:MAG: head protein, partial [Clostridia bacterium]
MAMVNKGRAGIAKLNLDGSEEVKYDVLVNSKNKEVNVMKFTIKVDSVDVEVSQEVKQAFDKMGVDLQASVARGDSLEAERDGLQAKVDGIPTLISEEVAKVKADAEVMSKLVIEATELGVKCDNLDVKGVKVAIVKAMTGRDVSDKSDSYIDAA